MIHREHPVHRAWLTFCKRCVAVPFEPAAHDRAAPRSAHDHEWQAKRGLRGDWLDTELALDGGRTFRCELKAFGVKLEVGGKQERLIIRLNELGHPSTWANSIAMYGQQCERFGVPLRANWRTVAQLADEHALAEIRAEEVSKAKPKADAPKVVKFRTIRRGRPTEAQIRKAEAARHLP